MNITVTVTLAPEVLEILKKFVGVAGAQAPSALSVASNGQLEEKQPAKVKKATEPTGTAPGENGVDKPAGVTMEDVRRVVGVKAKTHRDQIKSTLAEFDAKNVAELDPSKFNEFLQKIEAL